MSTRVQKGITVFRPIAKPRMRPGEARRASAIPETQPSLANQVSPAPAGSSSMPPPSTIPSRSPIHSIGTDTLSEQTSEPEFSQSSVLPPVGYKTFPVQIPSSRTPDRSQPPSIISTNGVPIIVPSRGTPVSTPSALSAAPMPVVVPAPNRDRYTESASMSPRSQAANGIINGHVPEADAGTTEAQIDPALLEAVVTALQHTEHTQASSVVASTVLSSTSEHLGAPENSGDSTVDPSTRMLRKTPRRRAQVSNEATDATVPSRPRRKRANPAAVNGDVTEPPDSEPTVTNGVKKATRRRRRASVTEASQTEDDNDDPSSHPKKKRKTLGRKRKSRAPSVPPFDPTADPGEELDPTAVTMGALCDDPGTGRVSSKAAQILSNHAAWRTANKEKRTRMRAIMEAKKYGRDLEAEEEANGGVTPAPTPNDAPTPEGVPSADEPQPGPSSSPGQDGLPVDESQRGDFDYSQAMSTSRYNVQVRIGPNGETIIDEESLFVDRNNEEDTAGYTHVEESDTSKFVNSATYGKKVRGSRWSAEETELFYDALSQFGENYELISYILPGRDRKACKNKFKVEDKKNPSRITFCLKNRTPYDIQTLSRMTGKDFSGPTPEIRAPTPLRLVEEQTVATNEPASSAKVKKKSRTPALLNGDEEIVGNISDMEKDNEELNDPGQSSRVAGRF